MASHNWRINLHLNRLSGLYLWVILILYFSIEEPQTFPTLATVHQIASSQAVIGIVSIALLVSMVSGQFDLSVGANANLTAIIAIVAQSQYHWSMYAAIIVAVAVGALVGVLNGMLVVKFGISSFIATLGMGSVLAASQEIVSNYQQPAPPSSQAWLDLTQVNVGGFHIVVLYLIVLTFIAWWFLDYTPIGRYLYAIGGNVEGARLSGVRVDRWIWTSLIISGTVAGAAGVLYASLSGPSLSFGGTLLLPAFAAVFLGSTQLAPGRPNLWGTILAIFVLATGATGLQLESGAQFVNDMFNGVALLLAVGFAVNRRRNTGKRARRRASSDAVSSFDGEAISDDAAVGSTTT